MERQWDFDNFLFFLHLNGEHMIIVGYVSWFQLNFDTNCRCYQHPSLIYPLTIWTTVCKTKNLRGVTALFLHWRIIISPRTVSNNIYIAQNWSHILTGGCQCLMRWIRSRVWGPPSPPVKDFFSTSMSFNNRDRTIWLLVNHLFNSYT